MRSLGCFRDFLISPFSGWMDTRSPSGEVGFLNFRLALNISGSEHNKKCRLGGWQRLLADSPFGFHNQDLHDQLTDCGHYYEAFSQDIFVPGGITGYTYPYFFPSMNIPGTVMDQTSSQLYYGDYRDYIDNPYPFNVVEDQWRICQQQEGFPDVFVQNYEVPNTGYEDYYQYPYFNLCYFTDTAGYTVQGYGYGEPQPTISNPYTYPYDYCGTTLYNRNGCRESITLLFEAVSVAGRRQLIAGTKSRISLLLEGTGNWRILADGLGGLYQSNDNCDCSARRFKAAQLGNTILFANDFDPVLFWNMDDPPDGCAFWSAAFVPDLQGLEITRARVVASWQGFMFVANVAVNGESQPARILWSDFNDPLSFAPGGESLAGSIDLGRGERILAIEPIGGQLRVYTSRGDEKAIYEVLLVGGEEVFNFREIYRGSDGIEYPNSLVNIGSAHLWFGTSGLMWLGEYDRVPTRPEWIHKASGLFYSGLDSRWIESFDGLDPFDPINREECDQVIGGYDSERKNIWFSWPSQGNACPNVSLLLNHVYGHASLVDHGFTAFKTYRPDFRQSFRDFLSIYLGCDMGLQEKEGIPYTGLSLGTRPAYLRNETEDPDLPSHPDSFCANISGLQLQDLCASCEAGTLFVMADAEDKTLKEFMPSQYFRERYVDPGFRYDCPYTIPGQYVSEGYYSMLQGDSHDYNTNVNKIINRSVVDFEAEAQTTPNEIFFQIAYGSQPGCMVWDDTDPRDLACIVDGEQEAMEADNLRPGELPTFNWYREGSRLAWRFYTKDTGGGACYNGLTLSVRKSSGEWT